MSILRYSIDIEEDNMFKLLMFYREANRETKYFIWTVIVYTLAIVVTTIYCYARLDFVR